MDIILYLLLFIQYQHKQICWLFNFICRYIPLKQWVFDDSHSPKYQKFKIDKLPKIIYYEKWDYKDYIPYLEWKYGKKIKPVSRRSECDIDDNCACPRCNAPKPYLYKNNGSKGQILCSFFCRFPDKCICLCDIFFHMCAAFHLNCGYCDVTFSAHNMLSPAS